MTNATTCQIGRENNHACVLFKEVGSKLRGHMHRGTATCLSDHVPESIGNAILPDAKQQVELNARLATIPTAKNVPWVGSPEIAKALDIRFAPQRRSLSLPSTNLETLILVSNANPARQAQAVLAKAAGCPLVHATSARESCPQAAWGITRRKEITL